MERLNIKFKGKSFSIDCKEVGITSFGLMFKKKNTKNLIFSFDKEVSFSVTSIFVFFNFLVLWLDKNDNVVDFKVVKPFVSSVKSNKSFRKILELPFNEENKQIIEFFVGKESFK